MVGVKRAGFTQQTGHVNSAPYLQLKQGLDALCSTDIACGGGDLPRDGDPIRLCRNGAFSITGKLQALPKVPPTVEVLGVAGEAGP